MNVVPKSGCTFLHACLHCRCAPLCLYVQRSEKGLGTRCMITHLFLLRWGLSLNLELTDFWLGWWPAPGFLSSLSQIALGSQAALLPSACTWVLGSQTQVLRLIKCLWTSLSSGAAGHRPMRTRGAESKDGAQTEMTDFRDQLHRDSSTSFRENQELCSFGEGGRGFQGEYVLLAGVENP